MPAPISPRSSRRSRATPARAAQFPQHRHRAARERRDGAWRTATTATCGKPAAVMVHVTVGTANTICGLMNAARDNVPILLAAGRTPLTETGHIGSRNRSIHWGQEAFDQGGMVREFVKWDYELRAGQPVDAAGRPRARHRHERAARPGLPDAAARGAGRAGGGGAARRRAPARGERRRHRSSRAIEEAARLIAKAEFPLIVTSSARPHAARRSPHSRRSPRSSPCRWCRARRATSTCRATIR